MERRTRIWIGLGTAVLVGSAGVERVAFARETPMRRCRRGEHARRRSHRRVPRIHHRPGRSRRRGRPQRRRRAGARHHHRVPALQQRSQAPSPTTPQPRSPPMSSWSRAAYAAAQCRGRRAAEAIAALGESPLRPKTLAGCARRLARRAWRLSQDRSVPVLRRSGRWSRRPAAASQRLAGRSRDRSTDSRRHGAVAQLPRHRAAQQRSRRRSRSPPASTSSNICSGAPTAALTAEAFAGDAGARRGEYAARGAALRQRSGRRWPRPGRRGSNNYRASVEAMDQRNALGRAFNGMTVLLGYELPLRRIGAGLFPANQNFQPSPFSQTSADDKRHAFEGATQGLFRRPASTQLVARRRTQELAAKIAAGFDGAEAALAAMDAPYERFLAPPTGSAERATAEAAVRALTDLARDLRQAAQPARHSRRRSRHVARADRFSGSSALAAPAHRNSPRGTEGRRSGQTKEEYQCLFAVSSPCATRRHGQHRAGAGHHARRRLSPPTRPTTSAVSPTAPTARSTSPATAAIRRPRPIRDRGRRRPLQCRRHAGHQLQRGRLRRDRPRRPAVEQSLAVAPLANGDVVAAVNATEDGRRHLDLSRALRRHRQQITGDAWGGETGAVEVVFGWPNANNDASPASRSPRRIPPGTSRSTTRAARRSWSSPATARPPKARAAPMPTATSSACSPPTARPIRPSTAASPSPTTRRRPSTKAAAASRSRPTARSSARATPISATRCATTSS